MDFDAVQDGEPAATQLAVTPFTAVVQPPPPHTGTRGPYTGTSQRTIRRKAAAVRLALEATGPAEVQTTVLAKVAAGFPSEALQAVGLQAPLDSKAGLAMAANIANALTLTKPGRGNQPVDQQRGRDALLQGIVGDGAGIPLRVWQRILGQGVTCKNIQEAIKAGKTLKGLMQEALTGAGGGTAIEVRFCLGMPRVRKSSARAISPATKESLVTFWEQSGKPSPCKKHQRKYWIKGAK